jgi:hypothetical protein
LPRHSPAGLGLTDRVGTSCPPATSGFTDQFATGELWIGLENLFSELCVANSE